MHPSIFTSMYSPASFYRRQVLQGFGLLMAVMLSAPGRAQTPAPEATNNEPGAPASSPADKRVQEVIALKYDRSAGSMLSAQLRLNEGNLSPDALELFRLRIVLGRWNEAAPFLQSLPVDGRAKAYEAVLKALDQAPPRTGPQQFSGPDRSPIFTPLDIADLADMAPVAPTWDQIKLLAALLKRAMAAGQSIEPLMQRLDKGIRWMGGSDRAARERAADLIIEVSRPRDSQRLLPPLDPKNPTANFPLLEKHAKQSFSTARQEVNAEEFQNAWRLSEMILAAPNCPPLIRERAWRRVADACRWVPEEMVTTLFAKTFKNGGVNALYLLKSIALQVNDDKWNREPKLRVLDLKMQASAAKALLASGAKFDGVSSALHQFTLTWIDEALYSKNVSVPKGQPVVTGYEQDPFGNMVPITNASPQPQLNPNQAVPVGLSDILATAPTEQWRSAIDPSLHPRIIALEADLRLKSEDDKGTLPLIGQLAALDAKEAQRVANEFLRVWGTMHDPHRNTAPQNRFVTMYGQQPKPGIPLTRALQKRNLDELGAVYRQLLPLGLELDRGRLVNAFAKAHSGAEVYRTEAIEATFGPLAEMDLAILAELAQTMRHRLAVQWRKPNVQQQSNTQRTDAQIDAEVEKGYQLVSSLIQAGLKREPENWRLTLADAATGFDWGEFRYGQKVSLAVYTQMRNRAFEQFANASKLYGVQLEGKNQRSDDVRIYRQWLNAHLGASDQGQVTRQQDPDAKNLQTIREAILALPGEAGREHRDLMARRITDETKTVPAHMKPTYMKAALAIVGDSPDAGKILEAVEYYAGLFDELELSLRVDGNPVVGHEQPFGAFLTLRHTADIERESAGGFSKYLRNDAQGNQYYFGGTPPVDQRDLLEKNLRQKLGEGFEILSITFHDPKVQSMGYGREGWRETPLAYLLLKPKDASVDRLPAVQLNMDFNDREGNVVLPVASAVQLIDARGETAPKPPAENIQITQVLDERALREGKLSLEVKAICTGLPPKFEELFDFTPADFEIRERSDSGITVQRLNSEQTKLAANAERVWLFQLTHSGKGGKDREPVFQFPVPKSSTARVTYKRYQDADLVETSPVVKLAGLSGGHWSKVWWGALGAILLVLMGSASIFFRRRKAKAPSSAPSYVAPTVVTPFSTLQFLRSIHRGENAALQEPDRSELSRTIEHIESFYFSAQKPDGEAPNLSDTIRQWLNRVGIRQAAS